MTKLPAFATTGNETEKLDVRLSYRIVQLFSEGLYGSPNKAIEELVANSFDAGAILVSVLLPTDFHEQAATIAVVDDGEGMDDAGLREHWLIGKSQKRALAELPKGRQQIGKFGIGKLATYVLANRLTHISKKGGKYYATSMDFRMVDERGDEEVEPKAPIKISLRELTEAEAKESLKSWTTTPSFKKSKIRLFGASASKAWTFAILSDLKEKVHEIERGRVEWVLRTALPLRDDFAIYLDGNRLEPSKAGKGRLKKWVLGKGIKKLPKPAPAVEAGEDKSLDETSPTRFALMHNGVGRITGYAEIYRDILTGKSDEWGRSHGFFVYVLGRLINPNDGHFGIKPDELRHGTFGRVRVVVHMDKLDDLLQSDREHIREGPVLKDAQNILRAIFNRIRLDLEKADAAEEPGAKLARRLAASPASLARRPIIEMARDALDGKIKSRYIALPPATTQNERDKLVSALETRAETPEQFVTGIEFAYDATSEDGIAVYDAVTGQLRVNGVHPFVGAFYDELISKTSGPPLEMFAMAEVLLESHLHQIGLKQDQIDELMNTRDQLLRNFAVESGRRTAMSVAIALRNARNDENQLEIEVVAAFRSLGFDAARVSGNGKPDGVARAYLSPGADNDPRRYAATLEAKSKKKGKKETGTKVKTKTVGISTVARHRDDARCEHAIVVAPAFDHTPGNQSALAKEIKADREDTAKGGAPRTITAIHVDDLARLVQLRPVKRLGLAEIRDLFKTCSLPEDCKEWIDNVAQRKVTKPPYDLIIDAIHTLQQEYDMAAVEYGALRVELGKREPPYKVAKNDELVELCKAMAALATYEITATDRTVELDQSPENVIAAIEAATRAYLDESE